jgi:hypothetical protein
LGSLSLLCVCAIVSLLIVQFVKLFFFMCGVVVVVLGVEVQFV